MYRHRRIDKSATITLTSDFHELLTGELTRGESVMIRYDPLRIWPQGTSPDDGLANHPVTVHFKWSPHGPEYQSLLESRAGVVDHFDADPTGQGFVLTRVLELASSAEELILWFSADSPDGITLWDSDYGHNFHFRFTEDGIDVLDAAIVDRQADAAWRVEIAAPQQVGPVQVRYRILYPHTSNQEYWVSLSRADGSLSDGRAKWFNASISVPYHATLAFDVIYFINGRRYKDDNDGRYFIAPIPPEFVMSPDTQKAT